MPPFVHQQTEIEELFLPRIDDRRTRMLLKRSLRGSGIKTRHSVCESFFSTELYDADGRASTADRNRIYSRESRILARALGRRLLEKTTGFSAQDITHVVFASCTGFANPGPDFHLIADLGLRSDVQRNVLGFMGCYAAVPALRMAKQISEADPAANVLVMCLELCSLHLQFADSHDSVLANSLFSDGAGAAIVSSRVPDKQSTSAAELGDFFTEIIPEGEPDMKWEIGNQGFDLVLSNRVPQLIESGIGGFVRSICDPSEIRHWAVHPGGKGILDKVEAAVPVPPDKLTIPREVMKKYGNMASATVLFVIKDILEQAQPGDSVFSVAFGPGLTIEAGLLRKC